MSKKRQHDTDNNWSIFFLFSFCLFAYDEVGCLSVVKLRYLISGVLNGRKYKAFLGTASCVRVTSMPRIRAELAEMPTSQ